MTTTESTDAETGERNASRRRQAEPTASPTAEGTDFQMVTFKENGMISKQNQNTQRHTLSKQIK